MPTPRSPQRDQQSSQRDRDPRDDDRRYAYNASEAEREPYSRSSQRQLPDEDERLRTRSDHYWGGAEYGRGGEERRGEYDRARDEREQGERHQRQSNDRERGYPWPRYH